MSLNMKDKERGKNQEGLFRPEMGPLLTHSSSSALLMEAIEVLLVYGIEPAVRVRVAPDMRFQPLGLG